MVVADPARPRSYFFLIAAAVMLVIVVVGFSPTFYLLPFIPADQRPTGAPYIYIHGAVMTIWYGLFAVQGWLIVTRQVSLHRAIGKVGIATAALVVITGVYVSLKLPGRVANLGAPVQVVESLGMSVTIGNLVRLAFFSAFVAAAVLLRRQPQWHGRLIYWSFILTLSPALASGAGRFWAPIIDPWVPDWLRLDLAVGFVALAGFDLARSRRIHPATILGAGAWLSATYVVAGIRATSLAREFLRALY